MKISKDEPVSAVKKKKDEQIQVVYCLCPWPRARFSNVPYVHGMARRDRRVVPSSDPLCVGPSQRNQRKQKAQNDHLLLTLAFIGNCAIRTSGRRRSSDVFVVFRTGVRSTEYSSSTVARVHDVRYLDSQTQNEARTAWGKRRRAVVQL